MSKAPLPPIFKDVERSLLERIFSRPWRPWVRTHRVRDHWAELKRDQAERMRFWHAPERPVPERKREEPLPADVEAAAFFARAANGDYSTPDDDGGEVTNYGGSD